MLLEVIMFLMNGGDTDGDNQSQGFSRGWSSQAKIRLALQGKPSSELITAALSEYAEKD